MNDFSPKLDLSLYLVTDSQSKNWMQKVESAVQSGVTCVQYREKNQSKSDMITTGEKLLEILKPYQIPLIINDHIDVAIELDADGLHIGQSDIDFVSARQMLGKNKVIGLTIENYQQAKMYSHYEVDYFGVGPVFLTQTKLDASPAIGIDELKKIRSVIQKPIVAIGGINHKNFQDVLNTGVNGIAVVSAIMSAENPSLATRNLCP